MKRPHGLILLAVILLMGVNKYPIQAQEKQLKIVTSTTILMDITRNVAGQKAEITSLVPFNSDVHAFEPRPDDIRRLADADLVIVNGLGIETFIDDLITNSGTQATLVTASIGAPVRAFVNHNSSIPEPVSTAEADNNILGIAGDVTCEPGQEEQVTSTESVTHEDDEHGVCDPHLWQDPTNVVIFVQNIRDALIIADPDNSDQYTTNAEKYIEGLQKLDTDIEASIAKILPENRLLVTDHDSLGYFAARYGLTIIGVVLPGGATTSEPTPQEVAALINTIKAYNVQVIFTENVGNNKLTEQISMQAGITVIESLYTDSLGEPGTPGETYIGMMRANLKTITEALGAGS